MRNRSKWLSILTIVAALLAVIGLSGLSSTTGRSIQPVYAQGPEPTTVIDAVLKDLSAKINQTLTRQNLQNYTWSQVQFPDAALGCPKPGVNYIQGTVAGYQVIVTTRDNKIYDYRTNQDASLLVLCEPNGVPATVAVTATAISVATNAPTHTPANLTAPGTATIYTNPIAYIGSDGNVYVTQANGGSVTPLTNDAAGAVQNTFPFHAISKDYSDLRWSPDGTKLLILADKVADPTGGTSVTVVQSGQSLKVIAPISDSQLLPTWSADGQSILYVQAVKNGQPVGNDLRVPFTLNAVKLDGSQPTTIGQVNLGVGCGGGTSSRLAGLYNQETNSLGGNSTLFAQTPAGIVYSTFCTGKGLALLKADGTPGWNKPDLVRAVISPDGTQIAALKVNSASGKIDSLVKVDMATGTETQIVAQPNADRLGWSGDGQSILYSTRQLLAQLPIPTTATLGSTLFAPWPPDGEDAIQNTITLWKVPTTGGQPQSIFKSTGYAIGVIAGTGDNQSAAISTIGSLKPVFDALTANQPIAAVQALFPFPQVKLIALSAPNANPVILAQGRYPAAAHGTFTAVAVAAQSIAVVPAASPVAAGTVAPPALVIGGKALVTATGAVLNVRDTPTATGKIVQQLENGMTVKIIGGPVLAGGYRWWQVQLTNGVIGWTIDQFTDATGTTNTLTPQ